MRPRCNETASPKGVPEKNGRGGTGWHRRGSSWVWPTRSQFAIESDVKAGVIDMHWRPLQLNGNWFALAPSGGAQSIGYSDIQRKQVDYSEYGEIAEKAKPARVRGHQSRSHGLDAPGVQE